MSIVEIRNLNKSYPSFRLHDVSFDINAREFQGRWFNDIRAWRIDRVQPDAAGQAPAPTAVPAAEPVPPSFAATDTADDLPF